MAGSFWGRNYKRIFLVTSVQSIKKIGHYFFNSWRCTTSLQYSGKFLRGSIFADRLNNCAYFTDYLYTKLWKLDPSISCYTASLPLWCLSWTAWMSEWPRWRPPTMENAAQRAPTMGGCRGCGLPSLSCSHGNNRRLSNRGIHCRQPPSPLHGKYQLLYCTAENLHWTKFCLIQLAILALQKYLAE